RQHAEVRDVPVVAHAVVGAVLAHGRDDDAVVESEIGEPERREQSGGHGRASFLGGKGGGGGDRQRATRGKGQAAASPPQGGAARGAGGGGLGRGGGASPRAGAPARGG